jgi:hypothetical protein
VDEAGFAIAVSSPCDHSISLSIGRESMNPLAKLGLPAVTCLILALPASGGDRNAAGGSDRKKGKRGSVKVDNSSPEKVGESFKAAAKAKDWKSLFACLTKESHKMLTGGVMLAAGFSTFGDKDKQESFEALLKKHGVDPAKKFAVGGDPTAGVKDRAALFGDLIQFLEKNSPPPKAGKPRKSFTEQISSVKLTNFKIDGATATADVTQDGKRKREPAEFKKIDGKWYLHFENKIRKGPGFPRKKPN